MQSASLPLLAATLPAMALGQAPPVAVMAPALPATQLVQQAWPASPRLDLPLDVDGDGSGRLVFTSLRTTAELQAIALLDPTGREVWRRSPAELGRVPRAQAAQPALGDAIALPEQARPAPGRWWLRLERRPPLARSAPEATLLLGWQLWPRHSLGLWRPAEPPAVNQPVLLVLRPTDDGRPVPTATLQLRVLAPGAAPSALTPRQDLEAPTGGPISREPGAYLVPWRPAQPGPHELQAVWQPPGASAPLVARTHVEVAPAMAQVHWAGLVPEGLPGCLQALRLRFRIELSTAPAADSTLALAVRLQGTQALRQFSTSITLQGRSGSAELRVPLRELRALGWPLQRLTSSQLTRFTPDLRVLATGEPVDLQGLLPPTPLCD